MRVFTKIWLLVWKNLLLRRRQYCLTAWEIILPSLFALSFAIGHGVTGGRGAGSGHRSSFAANSESEIMKSAVGALYEGTETTNPGKILFAPNNALANTVMENVVANLAIPPNYPTPIIGFPSEMEAKAFAKDFLAAHTSIDLSDFPYKALVVLENLNWGQGSIPPEGWTLSYKIRLTDYKIPHGHILEEESLYSLGFNPGPDESHEDSYIKSGFTGLQIALDKALITVLAGKKPEVTMNTMAMPYPSGSLPGNLGGGGLSLIFIIVLGFIFIVFSVIRNVISEKESGIKELMKMMGLPNWMHWLGWMINSMIVLTFTIAIMTLLLFAPWNSAAGAVYKESSPTLFFFVLFLSAMATTAFCFLISAFFQKPALGLSAGIVLYFVTYLGLLFPIHLNYFDISFSKKLFSSLIPSVGLHLYLMHMSIMEGVGGATWSNLFTGLKYTRDKLSIGHICLMLILDTFFYTALAVYFENTIPSEYGLTKPFYYPFLIFKRRSGRLVSQEPEPEENRPGFEPEPTDLRAGVVIHNLRKEFDGHKVAVNIRGTLKMYEGQITALLGQNGAGKTTTLSILTGLFAPSSGTASVNGYDIQTDMESVRMNLGLCPQHNMLFLNLTVKEHLLFFGRLRGLSKRKATEELNVLLWKMEMLKKIDVKAGNLSGGLKRRLCLAMALIGGTKVVILDEPTSGMDPEVRRAIWDLLLSMRGERTIVLTTHFMEEADVLGNRIAIMAEGEVKCCGTPSFLKKYYGAGYTLKLTVANPAVAASVLELIQKTFPSATEKNGSSGNAAEVDITIPTEANVNSKFPALFSALNSAREGLGIQTMGLALATMDDIFIKVGEDVGIEDHEITNPFQENEAVNSLRTTGVFLIFLQFYAVFWKRMLYTFRNWKLFIPQVLLPVGLTIMAILICNAVLARHPLSPNGAERPPLPIDLSAYSDKNPVTLFTASTNELATAYEEAVGKSAVRITDGSISEALLKAGGHDLEAYRNRYIVAGDLNADSCTAIFSTLPNHASPLSVNLVSNAILRSMTPGKGYSIQAAVHPFRIIAVGQPLGGAVPDETLKNIGRMFGSLLSLGLGLLVASYVVPPLEEKFSQVKQLQLMTGLNPAVYWAAAILSDLIVILLPTFLILLCFTTNGPFLANHGAGVIFLIIIFYGFSAIPFSYIFTTFGSSVAGTFTLITVINIVTGNLLADIFFTTSHLVDISFLRVILGLFPSFSVSVSIMRFVYRALQNAACVHFTQEHRKRLCYTGSPDQEFCCPNCVGGSGACFKYQALLSWDFEHVGYFGSTYRVGGVGQDLLCLAVMGIVYFTILIAVEYGLFKRLRSKFVKEKASIFAKSKSRSSDNDVQSEKDRVNTLVTTGQVGDDALVLDNLCKKFGSFVSVSKLSFGVHYGECFGLLGVNGAGKTTSFRMLTGDVLPSFGNAYCKGISLERDRGGFLSLIGYCPQFDGLIGVLTGREMVELFGRLRGIRRGQVKTESLKWLFKLGLQDSANVQCRKYSGGMKRRLCAAISLIGDPPIVLLDEPTSGVDPIGRRQFWKVIDSVKQTGQSVVLTSHSMEECEALCGRLGIMVNGQFQCMGGVQHLKTKFAMGYKLVVNLVAQATQSKGAGQKLKLKVSKVNTRMGEEPQAEPMRELENSEEAGLPDNTANLSEVIVNNPKVSFSAGVGNVADGNIDDEKVHISALCDEITNSFNPCVLRDKHERVLEFQVTGVELGWGEMFERMERIRGAHAQLVENYSITETTLEEVFLSFARMQWPERENPLPAPRCTLSLKNCRKNLF